MQIEGFCGVRFNLREAEAPSYARELTTSPTTEPVIVGFIITTSFA